MTLTITRTSDTDFAVVRSVVLADGNEQSDDCCRLDGNMLKSFEQPGHIRVGQLIAVRLGPRAFVKVSTLPVGETAVFDYVHKLR